MSTTMSRPPMSASSSDPFLSARLTNARRFDKGRRPSQVNLQTLDAVPENAASTSASKPGPPLASFRPSSSDGRAKGKARADPRDEAARRVKGDWILDLDEVTRGADRWNERSRVVLVIGSPTADTLAPLLYNPSFADTLVLVGSAEPLPSIEALTSPSYLLQNSADRTIYPTLQPFTLDTRVPPGVSPVPAIIEQATTLAQLYRRATASSQARTPRRRDSDEDSVASLTPPRTPPLIGLQPEARSRQSFESSSGSLDRSLSELPRPDMPKSASMTSLRPGLPSRSRKSTLSLGRESVFSTISRSSKVDSKPWTGGSPIDVVLNFIPPASDFEPQRAMQDMLHQAVVLTSGVIPILSRRPTKSNATPDPLAVSLLHVLPSHVPGPLPGVVENFLLSLVPKFAAQSEREIWSSVITIPAWLASPRALGSEVHTGAEALCFGGLRCEQPAQPESRLRAFLPNWNVCVPFRGGIAQMKPRRPAPVTLRSEPPSIGYAGTEARTPPLTSDNAASGRMTPPVTHGRVLLRGERPFERDNAPGTPELDPSYSSCSSVSGVGELGSNTGSDEGHPPITDKTKKKKGLAGWFMSKSKRTT